MSSEHASRKDRRTTTKFFASKLHHIKKMLKPVAKLLTRRKTPPPPPPAVDEGHLRCQEAADNAANEALEALSLRARDDEEEVVVVAAWFGDRLQLVPARLAWAPLPDRDIWRRGGGLALTARQTAQQQVPQCCSSATAAHPV